MCNKQLFYERALDKRMVDSQQNYHKFNMREWNIFFLLKTLQEIPQNRL